MRKTEGEEEESTNIVNYHLSVHMLKQKKEQGTVTTVVVSNIVACCFYSRIQRVIIHTTIVENNIHAIHYQ